jgi:hypothetical protein
LANIFVHYLQEVLLYHEPQPPFWWWGLNGLGWQGGEGNFKDASEIVEICSLLLVGD